MNFRFTILFIIQLFVSSHLFAQTEILRGSITNFKSNNQNFKAGVACYSAGGYQSEATGLVKQDGSFEILFKNKLSPAICILFFDSGDTLAFVGGTEKVLNFTARWYENMVIEPKFIHSPDNDLLQEIKSEIHWFRETEDSMGSAGRSLDEFDPHYTKKSTAIREAFSKVNAAYNQRLLAIQARHPGMYGSRAIIPVLLRMVMATDTTIAKNYDNNRSFQHYHFFQKAGTDSLVVTNPFLREKIYEYMNAWVNQQDKKLQQGADEVMKQLGSNELFKKYALAALTDYCTERNNFTLIDYIYTNYYNTCEAPPLQGKSAAILEQIKRLSKGNKAPELIMPDEKGNYFWLSQMKTRKYVVLFFWASWCPHCVQIMPDVLNYYHNVKPNGVDFVGVSLDDTKDQWITFITKNKLDWTNVSDLKHWDSEAVRLYALRGTPTFYVLDESRNIIGRTNDLKDLREMIK